MVEFKIDPDKTCLVIVDMTNAFLKPYSRLVVPGGRELIPTLKRLLNACRDRKICIIFVSMAFRPDRSDIGLHAFFRPEIGAKDILIEGTEEIEFHEEIRPQKGDVLITKKRFSAFVGTDLDLILRGKGIDTIIIGGVAANMCCQCTAQDARMKDYRVIFLSDGNAPMAFPDMGWGVIPTEEIQKVVLTTMAFGFAQVSSVEEVIRQLGEESG
jgi:ureidoacrylate peracid hydrolase